MSQFLESLEAVLAVYEFAVVASVGLELTKGLLCSMWWTSVDWRARAAMKWKREGIVSAAVELVYRATMNFESLPKYKKKCSNR